MLPLRWNWPSASSLTICTTVANYFSTNDDTDAVFILIAINTTTITTTTNLIITNIETKNNSTE